MEALLHDLRYAMRTLLKNPGFTAVAVFTLALGIGASTAIFSVVDGVLLRPAPFADIDRLMMVWEALGASRGDVVGLIATQTAHLAAAGLALGLAAALGSARLLSSLLYEVSLRIRLRLRRSLRWSLVPRCSPRSCLPVARPPLHP